MEWTREALLAEYDNKRFYTFFLKMLGENNFFDGLLDEDFVENAYSDYKESKKQKPKMKTPPRKKLKPQKEQQSKKESFRFLFRRILLMPKKSL